MERESCRADDGSFAAQARWAQDQVAERADVFPLRKLLPDHRRDQTPRLIDWPVYHDRIRIEAPDHIRETNAEIPASLCKGFPGGLSPAIAS